MLFEASLCCYIFWSVRHVLSTVLTWHTSFVVWQLYTGNGMVADVTNRRRRWYIVFQHFSTFYSLQAIFLCVLVLDVSDMVLVIHWYCAFASPFALYIAQLWLAWVLSRAQCSRFQLCHVHRQACTSAISESLCND